MIEIHVYVSSEDIKSAEDEINRVLNFLISAIREKGGEVLSA